MKPGEKSDTTLGLPVLVDLMTTPALAVAETDQISVAEGSRISRGLEFRAQNDPSVQQGPPDCGPVYL
jgi:hypothetical protein